MMKQLSLTRAYTNSIQLLLKFGEKDSISFYGEHHVLSSYKYEDILMNVLNITLNCCLRIDLNTRLHDICVTSSKL